MNRHQDDKPTLIKDYEDFKRFFKEECGWVGYRDENFDAFEHFKPWLELPLEYPCMVYMTTEEMDMRPGWDFIFHYFYVEDAQDLIIQSFLERAGM